MKTDCLKKVMAVLVGAALVCGCRSKAVDPLAGDFRRAAEAAVAEHADFRAALADGDVIATETYADMLAGRASGGEGLYDYKLALWTYSDNLSEKARAVFDARVDKVIRETEAETRAIRDGR